MGRPKERSLTAPELWDCTWILISAISSYIAVGNESLKTPKPLATYFKRIGRATQELIRSREWTDAELRQRKEFIRLHLQGLHSLYKKIKREKLSDVEIAKYLDEIIQSGFGKYSKKDICCLLHVRGQDFKRGAMTPMMLARHKIAKVFGINDATTVFRDEKERQLPSKFIGLPDRESVINHLEPFFLAGLFSKKTASKAFRILKEDEGEPD